MWKFQKETSENMSLRLENELFLLLDEFLELVKKPVCLLGTEFPK